MNDSSARSSSDSLVDSVADWLMNQALVGCQPDELLEGCSQRLFSAGIALWRSNLAFSILHPQYSALSYTWYRD